MDTNQNQFFRWWKIKMKLEYCIVVFLLASSALGSTEDDELVAFGESNLDIRPPPKYLKICHKSDKDINKCLKASLETLIEHITPGSKELNLPPLDPLKVPLLDITEGTGKVSVQFAFKNLEIYGLSQIKVLKVRSNIVDNKFEISVKIPYLDMVGNYHGEGGIMSLPLVGEGDFYMNLTDVSAVFVVYLTETEPYEGHTYYMVDQFLIDIIPNDICGHFGDTIDGDNKLGAAFNVFFNENANEIFEVAKPKISEALGDILSVISNSVLNRFPAEVLLPP